jgi:hypothetical protein
MSTLGITPVFTARPIMLLRIGPETRSRLTHCRSAGYRGDREFPMRITAYRDAVSTKVRVRRAVIGRWMLGPNRWFPRVSAVPA